MLLLYTGERNVKNKTPSQHGVPEAKPHTTNRDLVTDLLFQDWNLKPVQKESPDWHLESNLPDGF